VPRRSWSRHRCYREQIASNLVAQLTFTSRTQIATALCATSSASPSCARGLALLPRPQFATYPLESRAAIPRRRLPFASPPIAAARLTLERASLPIVAPLHLFCATLTPQDRRYPQFVCAIFFFFFSFPFWCWTNRGGEEYLKSTGYVLHDFYRDFSVILGMVLGVIEGRQRVFFACRE
jgi:hypothetical protein